MPDRVFLVRHHPAPGLPSIRAYTPATPPRARLDAEPAGSGPPRASSRLPFAPDFSHHSFPALDEELVQLGASLLYPLQRLTLQLSRHLLGVLADAQRRLRLGSRRGNVRGRRHLAPRDLKSISRRDLAKNTFIIRSERFARLQLSHHHHTITSDHPPPPRTPWPCVSSPEAASWSSKDRAATWSRTRPTRP